MFTTFFGVEVDNVFNALWGYCVLSCENVRCLVREEVDCVFAVLGGVL